mmetsp:Transcript_40729/g.117954  ORF Transcript_40729/g.117954 Transcript_40729/m.117954 type:complete len:224 (+) Transcript_40729:103-774(+)
MTQKVDGGERQQSSARQGAGHVHHGDIANLIFAADLRTNLRGCVHLRVGGGHDRWRAHNFDKGLREQLVVDFHPSESHAVRGRVGALADRLVLLLTSPASAAREAEAHPERSDEAEGHETNAGREHQNLVVAEEVTKDCKCNDLEWSHQEDRFCSAFADICLGLVEGSVHVGGQRPPCVLAYNAIQDERQVFLEVPRPPLQAEVHAHRRHGNAARSRSRKTGH